MRTEIQNIQKVKCPVPKSAEELQQDLRIMKDYLAMCARKEDWHGVMDASVDIREIVAKLSVLN